MSSVLVQAAPATARTIRWVPGAVLGVSLLGAGLLVPSSDRPADALLAVASVSIAAMVVAGLHDPASRLLEAVPVSAMRRRLLRLLWVGVPASAVWWSLASVVPSTSGAGAGPLVALTATGVAVAVWAPADRGVALGSAAPVVWFVLDRMPLGGGVLGEAAGWWRTDPWPVVALAVLACVAGRRR